MGPYGYVSGPQDLRYVKIDGSSTAIVAGDALSLATAGYLKKAAAGDVIRAIAVEALATADLIATDGAVSILADVGTGATYEYPADAGTVTQALVFTYLDFGGSQTVDIDATTDKTFYCVGVNTTRNTVLFNLVRTAA